MSTIFDAYVGVVDEVTYATEVAPTKFLEFTKESLAGVYERIESAALRSGTNVDRADRFVPNPKGASGDIEVEVANMNFAFWLKYMLGTVTPTGTTPKTYAGTVGTLKGKSFTAQVNRVDANGNDNIFTYGGGKVDSWELSNAVDGLLMLNVSCDFARETIGAGTGAFAKATPTFPANAVLLSFIGATVTVGGSAFDVTAASVKGDNGLKTDRYGIRATGTTKNEPLEADQREYTATFNAEFQNVAHAQRVAALTAAGVTASVTLKWQTPDTLHSVQVDLPALRFDEGAINVDGKGLLDQQITAKALTPAAGGSPVTITVITPDTTA